MKQPLVSYHGGKQKMLPKILPLIPDHHLYVEPFCGGASVFFAKPLAHVNVINDMNGFIVEFYRQLQTNSYELAAMIDATLYARSEYEKALEMYKGEGAATAVEKAWAVYVLAGMGFGGQLDGGWGYSRAASKNPKAFHKAKKRLREAAAKLEGGTSIENQDALTVIARWDSPDAFFYVDPPYFNSDMGHYDGYTLSDFEALLTLLSEIKGKFMLSSYPSEILEEFTNKMGWQAKFYESQVSVNNLEGAPKKMKTEVLTMNYLPAIQEQNLFPDG